VSYRILDSELLHRLIEIGALGLVAFVLMGVSVIVSARATIASRDPTWAPSALIGAAAAVSFLVVSMLFDVLSFPHPTYTFFLMAAFVAVIIRHSRDHQAGASDGRETLTAASLDTRTPTGVPSVAVPDLAISRHRALRQVAVRR
jgi:O-antigen ligase